MVPITSIFCRPGSSTSYIFKSSQGKEADEGEGIAVVAIP